MSFTQNDRLMLMDAVLNKDDWPRIIKDLTYAAANWMIAKGLHPEKGIRGYSAVDLAVEAIEKVYTDSGTYEWDPDKSSLVYYLKNNVIKTLVSNLASRDEVKRGSNSEIDKISLSSSNPSAESELHAELIISQMREELKDDQHALNLFNGRLEGFERVDILEYFEMSSNEYNSANNRLKTKVRHIEKKIGILQTLNN